MKASELVMKLSTGQLFKFILISCTAFYIPVAIISGILALFEVVPANLNDKEFTGVMGFIISILTAPIFIAILTIAHWIVLAIGLKLARVWFKKFSRNKSEAV
ncbi:MAG: hypothetical protein MI975_08880 [Cytophagales bacterium]|nr:hypothetical protein [Cytophagales bacterium]